MIAAKLALTTPTEGHVNRPRRLVVEALGCGLLVVALEGAHHGAEHLGVSVTDGRLFMSLAAGAVLACLTLVLRPFSGAHFNPALTFADALEDGTPWKDVPLYVLAQFSGGLAGRLIAHLMCGEPLLLTAPVPTATSAHFLTELVSTFGLLVVVRGCARNRPSATPFAVAAYVAATVWFTDSRSLANPALVLARAASSQTRFVHPLDVETLVVSQLLGAALAVCLFRWFQRPARASPPGPWTIICLSPQEGVAELAASLLNGLAAPARVQAIASSTHEEALGAYASALQATTLVLRLVPAGASPDAALLGEVWQLPPLELRAVLRGRLQRFLRERGWLRLYAVGDPFAPRPGDSR
ncbi:aquaporin [Cystobacter ferrugineus]|uniref:MIP family channel protein n=1 Tax=Cystobacter ferrugineus TaxID=83449 RepID=A0A1L9B481_9BACT|nr:aquaporin [Cystobacter ferrugineus]OJH36993.1 MIP family channel protein [Cystobacter ferrugineus]